MPDDYILPAGKEDSTDHLVRVLKEEIRHLTTVIGNLNEKIRQLETRQIGLAKRLDSIEGIEQ